MFKLDLIGSVQVRDSSRKTKDFIVGSCAQAHFVDAHFEQIHGFSIQRAIFANLPAGHLRVVHYRRSVEAFELEFTSVGDLFSNGFAICSKLFRSKFLEFRSRNINMNIDPIE